MSINGVISKLKLGLIAFTIITLKPPPLSKFSQQANDAPQWISSKATGHQLDSRLSQDVAINHFTYFHGSTSIVFAEAAYLDNVGQFSNVMSEFVDALLEKISFLAEIIIDSSLNEQCEQLQCRSNFNQSAQGSAANGNGISANLLSRDKFDDKEYTNIDLFISSYNAATSNQHETGCKLFSIDIDQRDLPIGEMEICCQSYGACYRQCGVRKLDCDMGFRNCLRSMCKQHFDYKNETLIKLYNHQLSRRKVFGAVEPLVGDEETVVDDDSDEDKLYADIMADNERVVRNPNKVESNTQSTMDSISTRTIKSMKDKYKACKLASKLLIIGNLAFGCQVYKQLQSQACCPNATQQ